jgi:ADP-ribose diphosphatase
MSEQPPDFSERMLESRTVYRGKLLHVLEDQVRMPDGRGAHREYIRHPGAVMMVPLLDAETVILVRQFRYPLTRHFYELPAGKIEAGEAPEDTARRELREECGYEAAHWRQLATLHPCVGYSDERIELFLARDLKHVGDAPEEGEFIEPLTLRLAVALDWVKTGRITDAKTIIGLMWTDRFFER